MTEPSNTTINPGGQERASTPKRWRAIQRNALPCAALLALLSLVPMPDGALLAVCLLGLGVSLLGIYALYRT
jgi:hypothetical protein